MFLNAWIALLGKTLPTFVSNAVLKFLLVTPIVQNAERSYNTEVIAIDHRVFGKHQAVGNEALRLRSRRNEENQSMQVLWSKIRCNGNGLLNLW